MTDKELRKLKRPELLEMLFYLQKELEKVNAENEKLRQQILDSSFEKNMSDADIERIAAAVKKKITETSELESESTNKKAEA